MPDLQNTGVTQNENPVQQGAWVQAAQQYLSHGGHLDQSGVWNPTQGKFGTPLGYKEENGQLVEDSGLTAALIKGGLLTAAAAGGGLLASGLNAPASAAADSGGVTIPGSEFDPGMVYGGAGGPTPGIPPAFGSSATDTVGSTAGASGASGAHDWLKLASDLHTPLTGLASGQAQGRALDNLANAQYADAQGKLYGQQLTGYEDALGAPGKIASNSVRGDILSNARDVAIAAPPNIPVPTISGGLRPSMFSDATRQTGKNITANAANTPIPTATMPTAPTLQPMETAGTGTDILNAANTITGLLPAGYDITKILSGYLNG